MSDAGFKKGLFLVVLACGLVLPSISIAQESHLGNWLIYIGNKKVNSKWNVHHEIQYRNYDAIGDLEQLLLRTGLGYSFNESKNNILIGYGYILSKNYSLNSSEKVSIKEHRIFQQFISKQSIGRVGLSHRYRLEERLVESRFKVRFRYFLGFNIPLTRKGDHTFYLSAYNEVFLNSKTAIFDRNRLYGGVGYKLHEDLKFELGYMNQFFEKSSRDQINIICFLSF